MTRQQLDDAFPLVVRYAGVALTVVLVFANIFGQGVELAAGYVAAAGMILYKTVRDGAREEPGPGTPPEPPPGELPHEERWSHLG